jgi:hypothetical protein
VNIACDIIPVINSLYHIAWDACVPFADDAAMCSTKCARIAQLPGVIYVGVFCWPKRSTCDVKLAGIQYGVQTRGRKGGLSIDLFVQIVVINTSEQQRKEHDSNCI